MNGITIWIRIIRWFSLCLVVMPRAWWSLRVVLFILLFFFYLYFPMLFYITMLPNIWCSFSGLKHCASFVDRFLIKPFLLFFFGLNLILNQFMIIYDSCVHAPTTSDVFFQVRGLALISLLFVCCCCCWFVFFLLSIWLMAQSKLILWFIGLIDLYLLCQNCCFWVQ